MLAQEKKNVVVFDLDSTISCRDTYLQFLVHVLIRSPRRWVKSLSLPFAVVIRYFGLRGNTWLKKVFLSVVLSGLSQQQMASFVDRFLHNLMRSGIRSKALERIQHHREAGDQLVLASASFDFYVQPLAATLGFESVVCTVSSWGQDACLQCELPKGNCYGETKLERVKSLLSDDRERYYITIYTDHHSDLPLLRWADLGYAVNPTKKLAAICHSDGFDRLNW